jgi:hypothetical protein
VVRLEQIVAETPSITETRKVRSAFTASNSGKNKPPDIIKQKQGISLKKNYLKEFPNPN